MPNMFLTKEELAVLTGRKMKSKQIEVLRRMGVPFWVNASGHPVVSVATVEGRREPAAAPTPTKVWEMPRRTPGQA